MTIIYSAQDNKIIDKWVQSISSGGMCINDTIMQVAVENLPFGGVGKFKLQPQVRRHSSIGQSRISKYFRSLWNGCISWQQIF